LSQEIVGQLLQELDGVQQQTSHVFVVAATNRPDQIDAGILSRFTERKEIPLPDARARAQLLEAFLADVSCDFEKAAVCRSVAASLEGVSGRDLKSLVAAGQRSAVTRAVATNGDGRVILNEADLEDAAAAIRKESTTRVDPTATWDRLILDDATKDELRSACFMLKSAQELERDSIAVPTALLLEGPPGTGKTQIARTLANESGLTFIGVTTSDLKAGYIGQSGERIKALFSDARTKAPCILFIDELDAVAGERGSEDVTMTEMVGQLLQELDGVKHSASHLFVVAATNRADDIDGGILSRFPWRIHIGLPDVEQRTKLLDVLLGHAKIAFEREAVCRDIAESLDGASGRDLKNIIEIAERRAMTRVLRSNGPHLIVLEESDLVGAAASAGIKRS
jgi:transitional endoplasmic reticulum ATPase